MKIKVYDSLKKFNDKHPVLIKVGAITGAVIIGLTIMPKGNESVKKGTTFPTKPPAQTVTVSTPTPEPISNEPIKYEGYDIKIGQGTRMRLEPSLNSDYIETINGENRGNLIAIDGEYALVKHQNPGDSYSRIGYVPMESIRTLSGREVYPEANPCLEYVHFTEDNVRIRTEMDTDPNERNILVNGKKDDYARVIGVVRGPEWSNDTWYLVAYKGYIGYMLNENGNFISAEEMQEVLSEEKEFIKITGTNVNFRSEPTKGKNNVITHLNTGDTLVMIDETSDWYHVSFNGKEGYVSKTVNCIERYRTKIVPEGLSHLHFDGDFNKIR